MPLYEYRCDVCEKTIEAIQKFADAPLVDCGLCGAKGTLKKQMSRTSFALKGNGWYTTDYKRASAPSTPAATEVKSSEAKPASDSKAPSSGST